MKLQAKFTLSTILIVLLVLVLTFVVISRRTYSDFEKFVLEKNEEENLPMPMRLRPLGPTPSVLNGEEFPPDSPEARFLTTTRYSLLWIGGVGILLAVLVSYLVSRLFLRRIHALRAAMNKYKNEGVFEQIEHEGVDEIDDLAEIYNLLIAKLDKQERIRKEYFIDTSHELKTPLTFIKSYTEGLVDKVFEEKEEIYAKILRESNRMIHLIREMTVLAKFESEEIVLNKETVDLRKMTKDVVDSFEKDLQEKNVKIEVQGQVRVRVDKDKFTQVLLNLMTNALQYGKTGGVIAIEMKAWECGYVWSIRNIPEKTLQTKDLEFLFERFYRGDKARVYDNKKQNLGIGLNIVRKIVELHGGSIEVKLERGEIIFEVKG